MQYVLKRKKKKIELFDILNKVARYYRQSNIQIQINFKFCFCGSCAKYLYLH